MTRHLEHTFRVGDHVYAVPGSPVADLIYDQPCEIIETLPAGRVRLAKHQTVVGIHHLCRTLDSPRARGTDPATTHLAAQALTPERLGDHQRRALGALANAGAAGLTDFALAERTGIKQTSIGKRRGELVRFELVENSGRRDYSDTRSAAIVWRITDKGIAAWRSYLGETA